MSIINKKDADLLAVAERKSQADSTYDRIRKYHIDPENAELHKGDKEIFKRWESIYNKYMNGFLKDEIIKTHEADFDVSGVTARNDMQQALTLFGDIQQTEKKITRHFVTESARELYRMSINSCDIKNALKSLEIITKANGLDKEDMGDDIIDKLKPIAIEINMDDAGMEMLKQIASGGVVNFNDFMRPVETITYEELEEDEYEDYDEAD